MSVKGKTVIVFQKSPSGTERTGASTTAVFVNFFVTTAEEAAPFFMPIAFIVTVPEIANCAVYFVPFMALGVESSVV